MRFSIGSQNTSGVVDMTSLKQGDTFTIYEVCPSCHMAGKILIRVILDAGLLVCIRKTCQRDGCGYHQDHWVYETVLFKLYAQKGAVK
jgi:hypothetical protein